MSLQTLGMVVFLRNISRKLGFNRWIAKRFMDKGYEERYDQAFSNSLRPGDVVWDVGANVGYYTRIFLDRVGPQGKVIAFEPSPTNFNKLANTCSEVENVVLRQVALGKEDGTLPFSQGEDDLGATSRVGEYTGGDCLVDVRAGAGLIQSGDVEPPNAIKIDTEGFELEVLEGLGPRLTSSILQTIGVEVHFGILNERGMKSAPAQIEGILRNSGFSISWPDSSHLLATRKAQ